jgi:hypothetical protein
VEDTTISMAFSESGDFRRFFFLKQRLNKIKTSWNYADKKNKKPKL